MLNPGEGGWGYHPGFPSTKKSEGLLCSICLEFTCWGPQILINVEVSLIHEVAVALIHGNLSVHQRNPQKIRPYFGGVALRGLLCRMFGSVWSSGFGPLRELWWSCWIHHGSRWQNLHLEKMHLGWHMHTYIYIYVYIYIYRHTHCAGIACSTFAGATEYFFRRHIYVVWWRRFSRSRISPRHRITQRRRLSKTLFPQPNFRPPPNDPAKTLFEDAFPAAEIPPATELPNEGTCRRLFSRS